MLTEQLIRKSFKLRQVWIWGDIEHNLTFDVINQIDLLAQSSNEPIFLLIHSHGGDLDCESAIIDEIMAVRNIGITVCTLAVGIAYSAGASILSMGTKGMRFARPNSSIMLHPCALSLEWDYEGNQRALMDFLKKRSDRVGNMLAKACGKKSYKKFLNDIDKGLWLTATEAVDYGVVDIIWDKPLPFGGPSDGDA